MAGVEIEHFADDGYWLVLAREEAVEAAGCTDGLALEVAVRGALRRRKPRGLLRGFDFDSEMSCLVVRCRSHQDALLVRDAVDALSAT